MKKVCIRCEKEKELNEFVKIKKSKDGFRNQCKNCLNEMAKNRLDNLSDEESERRRLRRNEMKRKSWENNIKNPEFKLKQKNRRRKNHLNKLKTDPLYKLKISFSRRLNKYLRRGRVDKSSNAPYFLDKLGCSFEDFKIHLESKFEHWMNWDNYGLYNGELNYGWDIDHVIPLSIADSEEEIYKLSHYTNLQPLCSRINRDIKKDKIENPQ
jgi:hypothetical protein